MQGFIELEIFKGHPIISPSNIQIYYNFLNVSLKNAPCFFLWSSKIHFVTIIIPKTGKLAINRYGKIAIYIEGQKISILKHEIQSLVYWKRIFYASYSHLCKLVCFHIIRQNFKSFQHIIVSPFLRAPNCLFIFFVKSSDVYEVFMKAAITGYYCSLLWTSNKLLIGY